VLDKQRSAHEEEMARIAKEHQEETARVFKANEEAKATTAAAHAKILRENNLAHKAHVSDLQD